MRTLRWMVLALGLASFALALGACGNKKAVQAIQKYADRMCECEDASCAESVKEDFDAWIEDNPKPRGTESDREKVEAALEKYETCRSEARGGAGGAGDGETGE